MPRTAAVLLAFASLSLAPLSFNPAALARPHLNADDAFPASPAGRCAKAFFTLIAAPSESAVQAFETEWASKSRLAKAPIEQRITSFSGIRDDFGTLTVSRIGPADLAPFTVFISSSRGEELAFQFVMSTQEQTKLDAIKIMPAAEATAAPISAELRVSTVKAAAEALRNNYVFPEVGAKMADSILAKLASGQYDSITSEADLALQLTEDCRAISHDKHLGIRSTSGSAPPPRAPGASSEVPYRDNFGFKRAEIFPGNIGYLRLDLFIDGPEASSVAASAMNFIAGSDAIIFDLRYNGGGSPDMIRFLTSYLFESSTHLNDMVDREGKVVTEYWTLDKVPGRRPRAGVPVYVLTSARTFSGAEEFSYNLQNLERATLIGETTSGGAHPVRGAKLNDRFMIRVPFMRARNPITRTNWEGSGVKPDVETPADSALDKALDLAREAIKQKK